MLNGSEPLWTHLASSSFYAALGPIVLGGILTYLKLWLPSEDDLRVRANLKKQVLLEEVNKCLQQLFYKLQSTDFDLKDLRGAPPEQPDLIADYTAKFEHTLVVIKKLFRVQTSIKACFTTLLVTVAFGVVGLLIAFVSFAARPYVSIACYLAIGAQILLVFLIRWLTGRFEECEGMS